MQFLFHKNAGEECVEVSGESFKHLKARRVKVGERLNLRNLKDGYDYFYEVVTLDRSATLQLEFRSLPLRESPKMSVAWAVVEPSVIEKTLPSLNELGVAKLIFVYTEFSQKDVRLDFARFERILINSCEQCGRAEMMRFEVFESTAEFAAAYLEAALVDFEGTHISNAPQETLFFVGAEGGFSASEREMFKRKFSLNVKNILRSNTAIIGAVAYTQF